jgi:hypothetical protein
MARFVPSTAGVVRRIREISPTCRGPRRFHPSPDIRRLLLVHGQHLMFP